MRIIALTTICTCYFAGLFTEDLPPIGERAVSQEISDGRLCRIFFSLHITSFFISPGGYQTPVIISYTGFRNT